MKHFHIRAFAIASLLLLVSNAYPHNSNKDIEGTLAGIKAACPVISIQLESAFNSDDKNLLPYSECESLINEKLNRAGIKLHDPMEPIFNTKMTQKEKDLYNSIPYVCLRIKFLLLKSSRGTYVYSIRSTAEESIVMPRSKKVGFAVLWEASSVVDSPPDQLQDSMRNQLTSAVSDFCIKLLKENVRPQGLSAPN